MLIAREKKKNNIVEYVIYMWHIEDLIRSYKFDIKQIRKKVIDEFNNPETVKLEMEGWYKGLIKTMQENGLEEKGHLPEVNEIVSELAYLHTTLLNLYQDKIYLERYNTAIPGLRHLEEKSNREIAHEVQGCLNGVYGLLLLRLQKRQISQETLDAVETFSKMLAYLAKKYTEFKSGKALFPDSMKN